MKTGYSFGSLASFVEQINNTTVKLTGDQVIAGSKTFSSNPISSAAQGSGGAYLTRRDFVENLLSYKAPTDSPAFTGNPTAPTAAQFDNDTSIATTAFVQRALGNKQGYSYTGDGTLAVSDAGRLVWFAGAGTLVLPPSSSLPLGAEYTIMCTNSGKVITASGDSFYDVLGGRSVGGSLDTLVGDVLSLTNVGDGWQYRGVQIPTTATDNRSTRPANTSFVRNYLESSPQLAGNVHVEGGIKVTQEFQSTNLSSYRIAYGDFGTFWYFNNDQMYLMFTNGGDKWGSYNDLRPFSASCTTGRVTMGNGVSVGGGLIVTDGLTVTGGVIFNQSLSAKQSVYVDGTWFIQNNNLGVDANATTGAVYSVDFGVIAPQEHLLPMIAGSAVTDGEGFNTRVKLGIYTSATNFGWERKMAGLWVGSGESPSHQHYLYKFNAFGGFYAGAVTSDTTITAGTNINAEGTISAPHLVSTSVDQCGLRFTGGPYGVMCYNDNGESFHFLLTNMNDQLGGFNNLRPLTINKRTGRVYHSNSLTVFGEIATDALAVTNNINTWGDITSAGSVTAKASYNNIPMGVTSYTRGGLSCSLGVSADAKPFMILMCPQYSSTTLNKSGMSGRVTLSRGSAVSGLTEKFVDFSIVSGYTTNLLEIYHQNAGAKIVTTTYNSVTYYALYFNAMSAVDVLFDGIRYDQDFVPILIKDASGYSTSTSATGELYARLASPMFTGTPTAPTAAAGTDNTQIATTAFVSRKAGGYRKVNKISSSVTMDESYLGSLNIAASVSAMTWVLPAGVAGDVIEVSAPSGYNVTIESPTGHISYEGLSYFSIPLTRGRMKFVFTTAWEVLEVGFKGNIYQDLPGSSTGSVVLPFGTKQITVTIFNLAAKKYVVSTIPIDTFIIYGDGTYTLSIDAGTPSFTMKYTYSTMTSVFAYTTIAGGLITSIDIAT